MTTVTLNLTDELQQFVARETQAGQFNNPAGYIAALIERAKDSQARLTALLVEGLESGDPINLDAAEWGRIRREVQQRRLNG
ncbi:type II toxin-antitoxin system ParD family antitoxin [Anatilimnocola sp. NA78]|uniref:ribbon-helix-helix domain-containing protein n=1 Tax=Anatilimnocola sp. NA78 TaxID=3415683 RepID=UPI003CE53FFD